MKMFDYYETLRKPDTKPKVLKRIEQSIVDLRWKIFEEGTKENASHSSRTRKLISYE